MAKEKNLLDGIIRFIPEAGYAEALAERLKAHTAPACEAVNIDPAQLAGTLDPQVFALMFTVVVEDLMCRKNADGTNLTDAYIRRHGWKLGGTGKKTLEAVRDSHIGLYEIAEIQPNTGFTFTDLLHEGETITVEAAALAGALPVGCPLAARVLATTPQPTLTGGLLPFEEGMSAEAAAAVSGAEDLPAAITTFWLRKTLEEQLSGKAEA